MTGEEPNNQSVFIEYLRGFGRAAGRHGTIHRAGTTRLDQGEARRLYDTLKWCVLGDESKQSDGRFNHFCNPDGELSTKGLQLSTRVRNAAKAMRFWEPNENLLPPSSKRTFTRKLLDPNVFIRHVSCHGYMCEPDRDESSKNTGKLREGKLEEWELSRDGTADCSITLHELAKAAETQGLASMADKVLTTLACNAGRKEVLESFVSEVGFGAAIGWDGYSYFTESMLFYTDFYLAWLWSFGGNLTPSTPAITPVRRAVRAFCHAFKVMKQRYKSDVECFKDMFDDDEPHGVFQLVPDRQSRRICCHGFLPRIAIREKALHLDKCQRERELLRLMCPDHHSFVKAH